MQNRKESNLSKKTSELGLVFHNWNVRDWEDLPLPYFGIDWPQNKPLLIATLDTFEIPRPGPVNASFIKANTPADCKVYFATIRENGHDRLQRLLQSFGGAYQEHSGTLSSKRGLGSILFGRHGATRRILVGSTNESGVLSAIFGEYWKEWYITSEFPFIIASRDFEGWSSQLENLVSQRSQRTLFASTIRNSHCIINTRWEHGMILISDKITRPTLTDRTRDVAAEHDLSLKVTEAENESKVSGQALTKPAIPPN